MRRFVTLFFLLLFTIPFGISISGCGKRDPTTFCSGGSGPLVGQVATITLQPKIFGISLNYGNIGQVGSPTANDCKGNTATATAYTYGVFDANGKADMTIADVVPSTGRLCAGTWNRNTGGGVADFTTCNPTNKTGTVYVVASANGATSNPLPLFIHPIVTSVVLGNPSTDCTNDPSSDCCPIVQQAGVTAPKYDGNSCLSQNNTGLLVARAYANAGNTPADNITCQVGHLAYTAQTAGIVTIDENGVATAQAPGSTVVSANISNASSSAGLFATCPPASIVLKVPPTSSSNPNSVVVNLNNTQPINATVLDTNKNHHHRPQSGVRLHHARDDPGSRRWNRHPDIPRSCRDYGPLPAAHLQSVVIQPDRTVRHRKGGGLKPHHRDHARHQQHPSLYRQHPVALRRSRGLHHQHPRSPRQTSLCA